MNASQTLAGYRGVQSAIRATALKLHRMKKRGGRLRRMRNRWARGALLAAPPVALLGLLVHTAHWRPRALHSGYRPVTALEFSPDGRALAVAGWDGPKGEEVQLWEVPSARLRQTLRAPRSIFVDSLAFSRDGKTLAGAGTSLRLWNVHSGQLQREAAPGLRAPLRAMGSSAGGGPPACGRLERGDEVRLWNAAARSGTERHLLRLRCSRVSALAVSADGAALAVASHDGTIELWDVRAGRVEQTIQEPQGRITALAFSPDGSLLAIGHRSGSVRLRRLK